MWRLGGRAGGVCGAVVAALASVCVGSAGGAVLAPGLTGGLRVVDGGLLWLGDGGGATTAYLSSPAGTRLVAPISELDGVFVEHGWTVALTPAATEIGHSGGPLAQVAALRHCPPVPTLRGPGWLATTADGNLYEVLAAGCLRGPPKHARLLVSLDLNTRRLRVIGVLAGRPIAIAADGQRIALTYDSPPEEECSHNCNEVSTTPRPPQTVHVSVLVLDTAHGRPLYRLSAPPTRFPRERWVTSTQIDRKGDVLVTAAFDELPSVTAYGWWGTRSMRVGRQLEAQRTGYHAVLWEGQIVYGVARNAPATLECIDLLVVATQRTRTVATFPGTAQIEGVGIGRGIVAWAQRTYTPELQIDGRYQCVANVASRTAELVETPVATAGPPLLVTGPPPTPRPAGPGCVYP